MEYFTLLNLRKEPFSNSPDPELFFNSNQHKSCLQKLELAIRLKRGLSVVIGDIGTGKSTLSRQLLRDLAKDREKITAKLILDPEFTSPREFLQSIIKTFQIDADSHDSEWQLKEIIKNHLFNQGVNLEIVPVLVIDEGQKLPGFCLEILREFLNYETNQFKLLQIIIFAQKEFKLALKERPNFADRITTMQQLGPLSLRETKEMIRFRINQSRNNSADLGEIFSPAAFFWIHQISRGYPRKIIMLCSKVILNMLITNKKKAGFMTVFSAAKETSFANVNRIIALAIVTLMLAVLVLPIIITRTKANNTPSAPETTIVSITPDQAKDNPPLAPPILQKNPAKILKDTEEVSKDQASQDEQLATTAPPIHQELPNILGRLTLEQGHSLGYMVSSVYGKFTPKRTKAVIAANQEIKDPNHIQTGSVIAFPRLDPNGFIKEGVLLIKLQEAESLQEGYDLINEPNNPSRDLRLRAATNETGKLYFQIILKKQFSDLKQATQALEQLPSRFQAKIISS